MINETQCTAVSLPTKVGDQWVMTSKPVEGRKYSANLPSFNNLGEHRKGKHM